MTLEELRTWARAHFDLSVRTRRQLRDFQPMVALRTPRQEVLGVLAIPKQDVCATLSELVRAERAEAIAVMMDAWVGRAQPTNPDGTLPPWPAGQRVRDLPGSMDALVVVAMRPDGLTGMSMARYTPVGDALAFEEPAWQVGHLFTHMLPTPWADRS